MSYKQNLVYFKNEYFYYQNSILRLYTAKKSGSKIKNHFTTFTTELLF